MRSIHSICITLTLVAIGCDRANVARPTELNPVPIIEDEAMKLRQWPTASAAYPNGDTVAGPTLFDCEPKRNQEEWTYYYADTGVFAGNFLMLPIRAFTAPLNSAAVFPGEIVPPSYTAVPALPAEVVYTQPLAEETSPAVPEQPAVPSDLSTPQDPATPIDPAVPGEPAPSAQPSTQPGQ